MKIKTQKTLLATIISATFLITLPAVANDNCDLGGKYSVRILNGINVVDYCADNSNDNGEDQDDNGSGGSVAPPQQPPEYEPCEDQGERITDNSFTGTSLFKVNNNQLRNIVLGGSYCIVNEAFNRDYLIDSYADNMIDVSKVNDMNNLFIDFDTGTNHYDNSVSIVFWNTESVFYMDGLFAGLTDFNQDIGQWDVSNVIDMSFMFEGAENFNKDLSGWDVSNVSNYDDFDAFTSSWIEEYKPVFDEPLTCDLNENPELDAKQRLLVNREELDSLISGNELCYYDQNEELVTVSDYSFNSINVSDITDMSGLFEHKVVNYDITGWDVSNVNNMSRMFVPVVLDQDISGWDVSNVTNMSGMFMDAKFDIDISSWQLNSIEDISAMFSGSNFNQDLSFLNNFIEQNYIDEFETQINITCQGFVNDTPLYRDFDRLPLDMFTLDQNSCVNPFRDENDKVFIKYGYQLFNLIRNGSVLIYDYETWSEIIVDNLCDINTSYIRSLEYLFEEQSINSCINDWDVSNVSSFEGLFQFATLNENIDLSNWCVEGIERPEFFTYEMDTNGYSFIEPNWGTCP